jgi:hypothetical protein
MNVNALWVGMLGAVSGAVKYGLLVLRRLRWGGVGVVAVATCVLVNLITAANTSPSWHTIRFLVACAMLTVSVVGFVADSRARRSRRSRLPGR